MPSLEYKRNRILEASGKLFMAYGYRRVSMEEIARKASVGKGTVYQLFASKQDLMLCTIDYIGEMMRKTVEAIMTEDSLSPIEKMQLYLKTLAERLSTLRPDALRDLETDFPGAFERIQQTRQRIIVDNLAEMLRQGKKRGVYDPEIDEVLVAHVLIGAADHFTNSAVLSQFGVLPDQIFRSILSIILKGCLAPKYRDSIK